jgi:hypothetical protein
MAYLGRGIENLSDRVVLDSLTASATASYTLQLNSVNFVPSSAESLTVSLNGVIQAPNSSYTVSSSTLTFSSSLSSSDSIDFIIAERGITLQTPSAGSVGTSQLASTAVTTAKIADDAVTFDKLSGQNYPAFFAYLSADQTGIGDNVETKVQLNATTIDTDSGFDTTTNYRYTIPSGKAGKYFITGQVTTTNSATSTLYFTQTMLHKNGTRVARGIVDNRNNAGIRHSPNLNVILDLVAGDYLELFVQADRNGGTTELDSYEGGSTYLNGFRIGD